MTSSFITAVSQKIGQGTHRGSRGGPRPCYLRALVFKTTPFVFNYKLVFILVCIKQETCLFGLKHLAYVTDSQCQSLPEVNLQCRWTHREHLDMELIIQGWYGGSTMATPPATLQPHTTKGSIHPDNVASPHTKHHDMEHLSSQSLHPQW